MARLQLMDRRHAGLLLLCLLLSFSSLHLNGNGMRAPLPLDCLLSPLFFMLLWWI
jgi:hypothetical protein